MIEFWGGLAIGGAISWAITYWYYVRSERDQKAVYEKLSSEIKEVILSDKRESLSVQDLNALLRKRVIDRKSTDSLPYKVCPKCGSENIYPGKDYIVDIGPGDDGMPFQTATPYKTIECYDCGWRDDEIKRDIHRIKE